MSHNWIEKAAKPFNDGAKNDCILVTQKESALTSIDGESNSLAGDCEQEKFSLFGSESECVAT